MVILHCPTCNKTSEELRFIGNFCESCVLDKLKTRTPNRGIIYTCRFCNRVALGNDYSDQTNKSLSRALNIYLHIKNCNIKVREFDGKVAHCELIYDIEGDMARFNCDIPIKVEHKTCMNCYRRSSGYFEAVIQARGEAKKVDKLISNITKFAERRDSFITKIEPMGNGSDIYVSNKIVVNEFFARFKLKPKRSYILYGLVRGKEAYRNVYSLHLDNENPRFRVAE
ncbi:MAG TPA: NMD3-related protein [Candidatus Baltobacteraceae bacterium]|nr:NMD3-related protein [Candidatus Baltobacteraceae bacterium]